MHSAAPRRGPNAVQWQCIACGSFGMALVMARGKKAFGQKVPQDLTPLALHSIFDSLPKYVMLHHQSIVHLVSTQVVMLPWLKGPRCYRTASGKNTFVAPALPCFWDMCLIPLCMGGPWESKRWEKMATLIDSVTVPIWLTLSKTALAAFSAIPFLMRSGFVQNMSSPTTYNAHKCYVKGLQFSSQRTLSKQALCKNMLDFYTCRCKGQASKAAHSSSVAEKTGELETCSRLSVSGHQSQGKEQSQSWSSMKCTNNIYSSLWWTSVQFFG